MYVARTEKPKWMAKIMPIPTRSESQPAKKIKLEKKTTVREDLNEYVDADETLQVAVTMAKAASLDKNDAEAVEMASLEPPAGATTQSSIKAT